MKKFGLILIGAMLLSTLVYAQKGKVASALTYLENGEIEKAWQTIKIAEKNPKTANWYKTFYVKGRILQAITESKDSKVNQLVENSLVKAYESYQKAIKLDEKGKISKTIEIYLPMLNNDFIQMGVKSFKDQKFEDAMKAFEYALKVGQDKVFGGVVDTSLIYNAGLAAYNGKLWDKAVEHLSKAIQMNYGGSSAYILLKNAYLEKGDTLSAKKTLQLGFDKYPTERNIIFELINYYLLIENDSKAALDYIRKGLEKDPENASLYFAEGLALDKIGKHQEAIQAYKESIARDSTFLNSYYNLGALIFNDGVNMFNECNKIMDNEKFKACVAKADEKFKESLPYLERAHKLDPKEINTMETLKVLYYRLHMYDKRDQIVKELEAVKSEAGTGGEEKK
ncbi:MAG TPA: tetratricopeptide repeat protein [Bacteroidetes bacterium]|nr:tetratricopeptide repeat protein [Bacteroidota bacterium]